MEKNEFNIEAFKSLREEINRRIDIHNKLVLAKFGFVGILLAYLLTNQRALSVTFPPLLISAAFAFLFDVIILENLGWTRAIGLFIRQNLESAELRIVRWEADAAQRDDAWNCFTVTGYLMGTWSIGALLFVGAVFFGFDMTSKADWFALVSTAYLLGYSLFLVFRKLWRRSGPRINQSPSPIVGTPDPLPSP